MKQNLNTLTVKGLTRKMLVLALTALLVSACSKKSSDTTTQTASTFNTFAQTNLASCNRVSDSNLAFNVSTATDQMGQVSSDWIKVKFLFLNETVTQTGNFIKFYKWRVIGNSVQLDSTPLEVGRYVLSNNQSAESTNTSVKATDINSSYGYMIRLNDDINYPYQVLKVVVYKADGGVIAQSDVLIPQFSADPNEYKINYDGTARANVLLNLHPLYNKDLSSFTASSMQQYFAQYCF